MKQVSVTDLKNKLSQFLRLAKSGETIEILERSIPVARLEGIPRSRAERGRLERLLRDGIVTRASREASPKEIQEAPLACEADVVAVLIQERGDR